MSLRKTPFVIGEYYHIYNRGVDKRYIFSDQDDHWRFMALLYLCNSMKPVHTRDHYRGKTSVNAFNVDIGERLVDIGAYCLMPNHFHIFVHERIEHGISMFVKKLSTAYSMYFNKKNERSGGLFEGKFKSKHIDNEAYFNWLFSYVHLNPIKLIDSNWKEKGISDIDSARWFMQEYKFSSYHDYFIGDRRQGAILSKDEFPEYLSQLNNFVDIIKKFEETSFN